MRQVTIRRPGQVQAFIDQVHAATPVHALKVRAVALLVHPHTDPSSWVLVHDGHPVHDKRRLSDFAGQELSFQLMRVQRQTKPVALKPEGKRPWPIWLLLLAHLVVAGLVAGLVAKVWTVWEFMMN